VWQCAADKPKGYTLALHVLLPDAGHHLGNIDEGALTATGHHLDDVVAPVQAILCSFACAGQGRAGQVKALRCGMAFYAL
jgi:hypothetical protein